MDWQPIETAPKDGTSVLLINMNCIKKLRTIYVGIFRRGAFNEPQSSEYGWRDSGGRFTDNTHWMPLPPPPKDELATDTTE